MSGSSRSVTVDLTDDCDDYDDWNGAEKSMIDQFVDLTVDSDDNSEAIIIDSDYDSDSPRIQNIDDEDRSHAYQRAEPTSSSKKPRRRQELRNGSITAPFEVLDHWPEHGLKPGMTVELKGKDGKDGDFVRIQDIMLNTTKDVDNILIRGQLLRRAKYVGAFAGSERVGGQTIGGKMKRDLNELALLFDVDKDDCRPPEEQSLVTVPLSDFLRVRRVVFTHEPFPRRSFRETISLSYKYPDHEARKKSVKEREVLVCRYAFLEYYEDARHRLAPKRRSKEACLRRIFMSDSQFSSPQPGTSSNVQNEQASRHPGRDKKVVKKRKITYGSGCCGAGGDSQGAILGGASLKYGWDKDSSACESFSLNHPRAKVYCREAAEFPLPGEDDSCDILHLSWPCDYFSSNHTRAGRNDEANTRAMFYTYEKLMSAKPRIHTQENTFGLDSHHPEYFGTLVQEIVRAGYNIRWKVDQFADHGLASSRKRVVIVASRIGVPLPEFPKPSHGPAGSGLQRYRTIHDAISKIPDTASWHLGHTSPYATPKPAFNARTALARCITRNGGKTPHPSGLRTFTPREMANLQGFPEWYEFVGNGGTGITEVREQIGNAIPPQVWARYIKSIVNTLEKFDAGEIDESGRPIVKRDAVGSSYGLITPSRRTINLETRPTLRSSGASGFSTPSSRPSSGALSPSSAASSNPSPPSSHSSTSSSLRNLHRINPNPSPSPSPSAAPHKPHRWSEESQTLSPSPNPFEPGAPSTRMKHEIPSRESRPSPFKRKIEPIDLTGERKKVKVKKQEVIDLTGDDWDMSEDW
ncbi:hypothetical protein FKW77_001612 [Venturia effusa]|uniref:DNA (cytosine-5-)-methyltransferase n=1 Tax=Venturia effusa TaxID=50376 RepID=A0A517LQM5_9PEZI|nr:hypothetical protein FKW77_001612 [Venturia effusa]